MNVFASGGAFPGEEFHLYVAGMAECLGGKRNYQECCSANRLQHSSLPNVEEEFAGVARADVAEWHAMHIAGEGQVVESMKVSATIDDGLS